MVCAVPEPSTSSSAQRAPFDQGWVPPGYTGPVALPGTGRIVYWTGRIAIGLRYAPAQASRH